MDKERRNNLRRVVNQCRRILESEISKRLIYYGILPDRMLSIENLTHLTDQDRKTRTHLEEAIFKEKVGGLSDSQAVERYIREVGFTYLNRIAALRAMEVRGLIQEIIIRRPEYGGRSLRERNVAESESSMNPDDAFKQSLKQAFEEVQAQIRVLFDESEYSLVFPEAKACQDVIKLLTEDVTEDDWKQDDIIGWIYQYYNKEVRDEFKKSRRKPTADDIPVINQFYTPHWVVRALVDNTLGRFWLEMYGRCPKLNELDIHQGVPDLKTSTESFAAWLKSEPSGDTVDQFCSYFVPLKKDPIERKKKSVQDIKLIDPACGSGHFLVYAFDVFYRMYKEAQPNIPQSEIPPLILEHNLHGIDIDLRSVQLAALSLYLKAKSYNPNARIRKMNLVCADARITNGQKKIRFLQQFAGRPRLRELFAKLLDELNNTNELGSLLKLRQPFEEYIIAVQKEENQRLGDVQLTMREFKRQMELSDSDPTIATDNLVDQMLKYLEAFEREAIETQDIGQRLFATEAEKSVGLLALLSKKYDVVLMNPPYGAMPSKAKEYLRKHYPRTHNDLYAAFIEQAIDLTETNGFVGMLTSRTFMFLKSFQAVREDLLWNDATPELLLDTGFGILDGATVETAASVLRKISA